MQVIKTSSYRELSKRVAEIVIDEAIKKPDLVLGLATGSTPLGLYRLLVKSFKKGKVDFSKVKTFNLDEYCGLKKSDKQSYHFFMNKNLFSEININKKNIHILNGDAKNKKKECANYEKEIKKAGGIDLQILGIGANGHIAFNEPGSLLNSRTRLIKLDRQTKKDNARFFGSEKQVPEFAFTMGINTILKAKKIILLATKTKKGIVRRALKEKISSQIPASFLRLHHCCIFIVEE
jgi:glucosamine-6-phosphate deaminase